MRVKRRLAATTAVVVCSAALITAPSAANADGALSNADIAAALARVSDRLATPANGTSDIDSIADNGTVDIRRDGTIHFRTENAGDIVITLPYASKAEATNGGATYRSANSATVTRLTGVGAQTLLVAANEAAPTEYPFRVSNGYVSNSSAGGLMLLDRNGSPVMPIPSPWAEDASGNTVKTAFVAGADQTGFAQVVEHHTGVSYPVVADPYITWQAINFTLRYNKQEVNNMRAAGYWAIAGAIIATACSRMPNWTLNAACTGMVTGASWWINQTFTDAASRNQCVWISVS